MPYIKTSTTVSISPEKETVLKEKMGKAIEAIPGKSEEWLMCEFCDNARLWFRGDKSEPLAFVEVMLLHSASPAAYEKMTGIICSILESELGISKNCIYVKYEETDNWGWNGSNF